MENGEMIPIQFDEWEELDTLCHEYTNVIFEKDHLVWIEGQEPIPFLRIDLQRGEIIEMDSNRNIIRTVKVELRVKES